MIFHIRVLSKVILISILTLAAPKAAGARVSRDVAENTHSQNEASEQPDSIPETDTVLDDLVVTASRKLVTSDGATLTYNASDDPESQTSTTLEILRKVPGVSVDAQDNIRVNGKSNFRIYLNGKEDPMFTGDVKTILKSMPASNIKKIEVISEPGAKYEAEGTGGILNIVTVTKQSIEGYLANISLNINNFQSALNGYGRMKINKVTAAVSAYYGNSFLSLSRHNHTESESLNLLSDTDYRRISVSDGHNRARFANGGFDLSWEPDTLNLLTVSFNLYGMRYNSDNDETLSMWSRDENPSWFIRRHSDGKYSDSSLGSRLQYQHTFGMPDHNLVVSYSFNHNKMDSDNINSTEENINYPQLDAPYNSSVSDSRSDTHIMQLDYVCPFGEKHKLEAGAKGSLGSTSNNSAILYGPSPADMQINEGDHTVVRQFSDIVAAYASYTGVYSKFNIRAGLRYEFTRRGLRYTLAPQGYSDFTNVYSDVVPNLSASYGLGDAQSLRLAYQMRIARPGLGVLNPFRNTITPGSVTYGNPDLKSEKTHFISLTYSNYAGKLSGSFKTTYHFSSNMVTDIIFAEPSGIIATTFANVGHSNDVEFQLNLNYSPIPVLNFGLYLSEEYSHLSAKSEMLTATKVNWRTGVNASADYTFPFKLRLSANGGWGSKWVDLQSEGNEWYYYSLGVSRSFLKEDRLTLTLSASNFLQPKRTYRWEQISETAIHRSEGSYTQWSLSLGLSWRFGGLNKDVRRAATTIEGEAESGPSNSKR